MATTKFYYIWIEGLSARYGEKIKEIKNGQIEYTTKITEAMRIRTTDRAKFLEWLREYGIADFVLNSYDTFVSTSYCPAGKMWDGDLSH